MPKASFGQNKKNQKVTIIIIKEVLGQVNNFLNKISSFECEPLFKIFTFVMVFLRCGDELMFLIDKFADR